MLDSFVFGPLMPQNKVNASSFREEKILIPLPGIEL
jgi:hypothetical protein